MPAIQPFTGGCLCEAVRFAAAAQREIWLAHRISWNALNPALPSYAGFSKDG